MATARVSTPATANPGEPSSDRRAILKSCLIAFHLLGRRLNCSAVANYHCPFSAKHNRDASAIRLVLILASSEAEHLKLRTFPSAASTQWKQACAHLPRKVHCLSIARHVVVSITTPGQGVGMCHLHCRGARKPRQRWWRLPARGKCPSFRGAGDRFRRRFRSCVHTTLLSFYRARSL